MYTVIIKGKITKSTETITVTTNLVLTVYSCLSSIDTVLIIAPVIIPISMVLV